METSFSNKAFFVSHVGHYVGGGEESLRLLLKYIDLGDCTPLLVAPPGKLHDDVRKQGGVSIVVSRLLFCWYLAPIAWVWFLAFLICMEVRSRAAVVHTNSVTALTAIGPPARLLGYGVLLHARVTSYGILDKMPAFVWRLVLWPTTVIVAVSATVESTIRFKSRTKKRVQVVPNGIEMDAFAEIDGQRARQDLGIADDRLVISSIGRLVPWKKHEDLIEAARLVAAEDARSVKRVIIMFVGGADSSSRAYEQDLRHRASLLEGIEVRFLGHLEHVAVILAASDVFVSTARGEAFGRVVIEAMAAGCLVVCRNDAGPAEIVTPGRTGLLYQDVEDLASVLKLIEGYPGIKKMRENARADVAHHYVAPKTAAQVAQIINRLKMS